MEVFRKIFVLALLSIVSTSCIQDDMNIVDQQKDSISGEDIFKGIYFQEGEFVNMVETISDVKSSEMKLSPEMQLENNF